MEFRDAVAARRSAYSLDDGIGAIGASEGSVIDALRRVIPLVPSAFNMRSVRTVVLFGDDHRRLWREVGGILRARMEGRDFSATEAKMASFSSAAGTILFYEDTASVADTAAANPRYAGNFPVWSEQGIAMAQYAAWVALCDMGLGANLQHYNPLIDDAVKARWGVPVEWALASQMVFGGISAPAAPPDAASGAGAAGATGVTSPNGEALSTAA